jgi:hypothetical protein
LNLNIVGEAALLLVRGGGDGRYPGGKHCGPCRDLVCGTDRDLMSIYRSCSSFLPLLVFVPKPVRCAMKADADAVIDAFGKNEQVKKVFRTLFVAMAGLVLPGWWTR